MDILYVEDDPVDADLLRRELGRTAPEIRLEVVCTQREALAHLTGLEARRYDLVLADMRLPDGDGLAILSHIRGRALPVAVVLITGSGDEETAVAVLKAGADDYVAKRGNYLARLPLTLEAALHRHRAEAARRTQPLRVLYAEHNAADIDLTRRHLAHHAPHIHLDVVHTAAEVLRLFPGHGRVPEYDLLLLDYRLPGLNALDVLKELRQTRGLNLPVVLVTGQGDEEVALQTLKLGAADYLPKNAGYLHQLPSVLENVFHRDRLGREQAALRESEERFRRAFEDAAIGMCLTGIDGRFLAVNGALCKMLGYSREELTAKTFRDITHPEDMEASQRWVESLLAGKPVSQRMEKRYLCKDGRSLWATVTTSLLRDVAGAPFNFITQIQDITHRKALEEERLRLEAQLRQQQRLEAIGILASGVAHEINNPIAGIMNYAQLIADKVEPKSQTAEYAGEILQETERVATIVRNLLQFARQEKQAHSPARLADLVEQTLSLLRAVFRRDQITLTVDVPADLPPLKCRSQQIEQVLMNLLTNARDTLNAKYPGYHADKTIRVTVRPFEQAGRRWLRLTVADQGTGIPPEIQARIFDPFFTTKPRDKGSGLGLSISHGIVQDHHGRLHFETVPGQGTQFHLDLPVDTEGE